MKRATEKGKEEKQPQMELEKLLEQTQKEIEALKRLKNVLEKAEAVSSETRSDQ
jgi:hypothetical protein